MSVQIAIDRWHELLMTDPLATWEQVQSAMQADRLYFGARPVCSVSSITTSTRFRRTSRSFGRECAGRRLSSSSVSMAPIAFFVLAAQRREGPPRSVQSVKRTNSTGQLRMWFQRALRAEGWSRGSFRHSGGGEKDGGGPVTKRLRNYRMFR